MNFGVNMRDDIAEILFGESLIQRRVRELGEQITKDYLDKNPILICILKGAVHFFADLFQGDRLSGGDGIYGHFQLRQRG